jgi:hypothetical protein
MSDPPSTDRSHSPAHRVMDVVLLLVFGSGGLLLGMNGLGRETPLVQLAFDATWMNAFLVVLGVLLLGDAVRTLTLFRRPPLDSLDGLPARRMSVIRWRGISKLLVAAALVAILLKGTSLGVVEIHRGAWALWVLAGVLTPLGLGGVVIGSERMARASRLFGDGGVRGVGTIDRVVDTGWRINDNPRFRFDLTVSIDGQPPYSAQLTDVVPLVDLGRVVKGGTLPVLVDREDPEHFVILWKD